MNMYINYMQDLINYIGKSWLATLNHSALQYRGSIRGCSLEELEKIQQSTGNNLPAALVAWYLTAGQVPPYLYDYDADFSIRDLVRAQKTIEKLSAETNLKLTTQEKLIAFSQRIGMSVYFVDPEVGQADDPSVFLLVDGADMVQVGCAFSVFIREYWLRWLEYSLESEAAIQRMDIWRRQHGNMKGWHEKNQVIFSLHDEAEQFRIQLLEEIYASDIASGKLTGSEEFQQIWINRLSKTSMWSKYKNLDVRIPFNWIEPPKEKSEHLGT